MILTLKDIKSTIKIDNYDFIHRLTHTEILDLIRVICEDTTAPMKEIRKIVNDKSFDD